MNLYRFSSRVQGVVDWPTFCSQPAISLEGRGHSTRTWWDGNRLRQDCLNHLPGMVRLVTHPVPEGRAEPVRHGREMIDDFRRWGRSRRRGMDAPLRNEGWRVEVARELDNAKASLSEGEACAAVVGASPKRRNGREINGCPASVAVQLCAAAPRTPPPCRSRYTHHTRGDAGGVSDPPVLGLWYGACEGSPARGAARGEPPHFWGSLTPP